MVPWGLGEGAAPMALEGPGEGAAAPAPEDQPEADVEEPAQKAGGPEGEDGGGAGPRAREAPRRAAQLACGQLHSLQWAGTLNTLQAQWAPGEAQLNNHPLRLEKKKLCPLPPSAKRSELISAVHGP